MLVANPLCWFCRDLAQMMVHLQTNFTISGHKIEPNLPKQSNFSNIVEHLTMATSSVTADWYGFLSFASTAPKQSFSLTANVCGIQDWFSVIMKAKAISLGSFASLKK
jgi:hypothetical protein